MWRAWTIAIGLGVAALLPAGASASHVLGVPGNALSDSGDDAIVLPSFDSDHYGQPWLTVANVGDVDGDGNEDLAAALPLRWDLTWKSPVFVVFGAGAGEERPAAVGDRPGFQIEADWFGHALTGVGDVNRDGRDDIALIADGKLHVVFGKADGGPVDVASLGDDGFTIEGGVGYSGGSGGNGVYPSRSVAAVGDQNGDGRPDVAFTDPEGWKIAYTPADPAGKTLDADALGEGGATLLGGSHNAEIAPLGDLNGDGRIDLLVGWEDDDTRDVHVMGVAAPAAGETVDVADALADGDAFELVAQGAAHLNRLAVVGDQNGDGVRDFGVAANGLGKTAFRFTPPLGTSADLRAWPGFDLGTYSSDVIDPGDQNGDGRGDVAASAYVRFTDDAGLHGGEMAGHGFYLDSPLEEGWTNIVATVSDRNGDGKREMVVAGVHAPSGDYSSGWHGRYRLDVFDSAEQPQYRGEDPVTFGPDGGAQLGGEFDTGAVGAGDTLAGAGVAEIIAPEGYPIRVAAPPASAAGPTARVSVAVPANQLWPGATYRYSLLFENGRGLAARGPERSFTVPSIAPPALGAPGPLGRTLYGTARRDRLLGTPYADRLFGRRGNDVLDGGRGDDQLFGGRGRDRLYGRAGRDWLDGGAGGDRLYGGTGADRLLGRSGADLVAGGAGEDLVDAGAGDDLVLARDGVAEVVQCGRGTDRVLADRRDRLLRCERRLRTR